MLIGMMMVALHLTPTVPPGTATRLPASFCVCPTVDLPVCGSNGMTYSNVCRLRCANRNNVQNGVPPISITNEGVCPGLSCTCPTVDPSLCERDVNKCRHFSKSNRRKRLVLALCDPKLATKNQGRCRALSCSSNSSRVCGTDGRTYASICHLQAVDKEKRAKRRKPIVMKHAGPCLKPSCTCPDIFEPVCASDGKTYDNACIIDCENGYRQDNNEPLLRIILRRSCNQTCICPDQKDEVCGSDGRTYKNPCDLRCESSKYEDRGMQPVTKKFKGPCNTTCNCPKDGETVCGSDGNTYTNDCALQCESMKQYRPGLPRLIGVYKGSCGEDCQCTRDVDEVCASDGRTYRNPCIMACESRDRQELGLTPLKEVKTGPCKDGCNCKEAEGWVCGSDGVTYTNACFMLCASQKRLAKGLVPIDKVSEGACGDSAQVCLCDNCPKTIKYVCGSDRRTYTNICWLECTSNCYQKRGLAGLKYIRDGRCW